jgi:DNA-binding IclR family transcriptional regulator
VTRRDSGPKEVKTGEQSSLATQDGKDDRRIPLQKAMRIIEQLAVSDQSSWGVRELARALDLAPSTVYRLLCMLEEVSIVESKGDGGRYGIALDFFRLASQIAQRLPMRETARRELQTLAGLSGESVYLARYEPKKRSFMFVDHIVSTHPLRYEMALYEWLDLRIGAGGLGILAFLPAEEIDSVLSQEAPSKLTERTVTDRRLIEAELERVRQQGYVVSIGRRIVGAVGIAAPIVDAQECVVGAVVLALPESHLPEYDAEGLAADVVRAARMVSAGLGAQQPATAHSGRESSRW